MQHELQGIQTFVKIAETRHFTKAAELLNISQSALTRRIKKLEEELDVTLFERSTRQVTLTKIGEMFLPKAVELLASYHHSIASINELSSYQSETIVIASIPTAALYFLPSVISLYREEYPNVKIKIQEYGSTDTLEHVLNGDADFGINMTTVTHNDIDMTQLANEPFMLCCHKEHPLAQQKLVTWDELKPYAFIGMRKSSGNRSIIEQHIKSLPWKPNWFYEVRHLSTSIGLVEANLGIAVIPSLAMSKEQRSNLIGVTLVEPVIRRTLALIQHKEKTLTPAASRFKALLLEQWVDQIDKLWIEIQTPNQ